MVLEQFKLFPDSKKCVFCDFDLPSVDMQVPFEVQFESGEKVIVCPVCLYEKIISPEFIHQISTIKRKFR